MELGCLLEYKAPAYFMGSLSEPVSCIVGAYHAQYHTKSGSYVHEMGIREGGSLALLASVGPMGIGAIDYAMHAPRKPRLVVVTDIDEARLARAASIFTVEEAKRDGVELHYVDTKEIADPVAHLKALNGGKLFDDVFVFAPVKSVVEMGDRLLGSDGCLNFFAGPTDTAFSSLLNFYDVHYESHHLRRHFGRQYGRHQGVARDDGRRPAQSRRDDHPCWRTERRARYDDRPRQYPRRQEAHLHAQEARPRRSGGLRGTW